MAKIPLKDYAKKHNKESSTVRRKAINGGFRTAEKMGYMWVIDEDEPYTDLRVHNGKYKNWRKKKQD